MGVDNVGTGDTNLPPVAAGGHEDIVENGLARCNGTVEITLERGVQIDILRSSVGFTSWSALVDVRCVLETGTLSGDVAVVG